MVVVMALRIVFAMFYVQDISISKAVCESAQRSGVPLLLSSANESGRREVTYRYTHAQPAIAATSRRWATALDRAARAGVVAR
jgi:Cys-tRNA synthase (O-phospho-L-seryl-tRNA:Cys-tRNA synthase)